METNRPLIIVCVFAGLVCNGRTAHGWHMYGLDGSRTPLEAIDSVVTVSFGRNMTAADLADFAGTRSELVDSYAVRSVGPRFWAFGVDAPAPIDTVLQNLRGAPGVELVNPVFTGVSGNIYMTDEIIIYLADDADSASIDSLHFLFADEVSVPNARRPKRDLVRLRGSTGLTTLDVANRYYASRQFRYAQPNFIARGLPLDVDTIVPPIDPLFPKQWHLKNTGQAGGVIGADIGAVPAWEITRGDPAVTVAIIEFGGFDILVEDALCVVGRITGWDVTGCVWGDPVLGVEDPYYGDDCCSCPGLCWDPLRKDPRCWHGTAILGELASCTGNDTGLAGLADGCSYYCVKMGDFIGMSSTERIVRALELVWEPPVSAKILSCSWGWNREPDIDMTLDAMRQDGVAIFWAAGNFGTVDYPADLSSVYAVGATRHTDTIWDYSGKGPTLDFVAPSGAGPQPHEYNIWTWDIEGLYGACDGWGTCNTSCNYSCMMGKTSAAAPLAAGVAALVLSRRQDFFAYGDVSTILFDILKRSAVDMGAPGKDTTYGWGRVSALRALVAVTRGDINTDGAMTVLDVVALVAEVFRGGPPPEVHPGLSDVTCDGIKDALDVTFLTNHVFRGGPMPGICYWYNY